MEESGKNYIKHIRIEEDWGLSECSYKNCQLTRARINTFGYRMLSKTQKYQVS